MYNRAKGKKIPRPPEKQANSSDWITGEENANDKNLGRSSLDREILNRGRAAMPDDCLSCRWVVSGGIALTRDEKDESSLPGIETVKRSVGLDSCRLDGAAQLSWARDCCLGLLSPSIPTFLHVTCQNIGPRDSKNIHNNPDDHGTGEVC